MCKLGSTNSIISATSTGNAKINKKEVIKIYHTYRGKSFINIVSLLWNKIVHTKLIEATIEDAPAK